jgi:hypothetical protein
MAARRKIEDVRKCARAMPYLVLSLLIFIITGITFAESSCFAAEVSDVDVRQVNNELIISTALQPDEKLVEDLNNGLSKELVFYIDLFRHWKLWPDEFVIGQKIVRVLQIDPIKREYIGTNVEGNIKTIKRFKDLDTMIVWATNISGIKLTNVRVLEPDDYYVKVTAESNLRKLPSVVGYLLFFVPSKEFSVFKESPTFKLQSSQVVR